MNEVHTESLSSNILALKQNTDTLNYLSSYKINKDTVTHNIIYNIVLPHIQAQTTSKVSMTVKSSWAYFIETSELFLHK